MDWFAWLSQTEMEPSLVYEYGMLFAQNELEEEDTAYFNHEFLQSLGVGVAKHRLQILRAAKRERGRAPALSRLFAALKKTNRRVRRCVRHWVRGDHEGVLILPKVLSPMAACRGQGGGAGGALGLWTKNSLVVASRGAAARSPMWLSYDRKSVAENRPEYLSTAKDVWWASMFENLKPT